MSDLRTTNKPVLITEHGNPSAYLVDVEHCALMESRIELPEALDSGERAILEGQTSTQSEVKKRLAKWL